MPKPPPLQPRTIAYCRVSTDAQAEEGRSLEVQRRQLEGWAQMKDRILDLVVVEPGVSGGTLDLRALGAIIRQMQGEVRALGLKLDLLTKGRERDIAFATRDDLHDIVGLLAAQLTQTDTRLADFDQRISGVVGQVAEQMERHGKMLADILDRLPPLEQS